MKNHYLNFSINKSFIKKLLLILFFTGLVTHGFASTFKMKEINKKSEAVRPENTTRFFDCGIPANLEVSNITTTSASLSWEAISEGTAVMYQYCIVQDNTPVPGPTSMEMTGSSYEDLLPNTSYNAFVRAMCDGGVWGEWSEAANFTTLADCGVFPSISENFEGEAMPSCWSIYNGGDENGWEFNAQNGNNGGHSVRLNFTPSVAHNDYFISPHLSVTEGFSDYLTFYSRNGSSSSIDKFNILISTTGNEPEDFTETLATAIEPSTSWTSYEYDLSDYVGEEVYIAFQAYSEGGFQLYLDDIWVQSTCLAPTGITFGTLSASTGYVNWTAGGEETEWEILYGETGFDPETEGQTITDITSATKELTGLEASTAYDVYVRAICDDNNSSLWSNPGTFVTAPANDDICDAIALTIDAECTGGMFTNESATGQTDEPAPSCWWAATYPHTVWFTFEAPDSGNVTITTDIPGGTLTNPHMAVYSAPEGCADISTLEVEGCSENDGEIVNGNMSVIELVGIEAGQTYYVQIGGYFKYMGTFCVEVHDNGTCLPPSNVTFNNITSTSAKVNWSVTNNDYQWNVMYGEPGFDPETEGTTLLCEDGIQGQLLSDLDPGTTYDVYVQTLCGAEDGDSLLTGPLQLTTAPANDNVCNATALTVDAECTGAMYSNRNATHQPNEPQGSCYSSLGSGGVWFTFEAPDSGNVTVTTDIAGATLTNTQIAIYEAPTDCADLTTFGNEVGCDKDSGDIVPYNSIASMTGLTAGETYYVQVNGQYSTSQGEFCIEVLDDGTCLAPTDITFDNLTATTADVSWTEGYTETEWEILYGEEGFDPENEGTSVLDNDDELGETLTDLTAGTTYDVYVRSVCGTDTQSEWTGPESFSTRPANDNLCDAIALTIDAECTGASFTNGSASIETGEVLPDCWGNTSYPRTVWFTFEAPNSGNVIVTTDVGQLIGGLYYKQAAVYNAPTDCSDLTTLGSPIGCADQNGGENSDYSAVITLGGLTPGETYYVAVDGAGSSSGPFCIEVQDNGGCVAPTDITYDNVSYDSADISWTSNGGETEWEIVYGEEDFNPESEGTTVTDEDGEVGTTLSNLDPDTEYDIYVRAVCGDEDSSELTGPVSFTTEVAPPSNDDLCNATALEMDEVCTGAAYTNESASTQVNEPIPDCWIIGATIPQTVWFSFVAPASGNVTVAPNDSGSLINKPHIAIYEAPTDCEDLSTLEEPMYCGEDVGSNNSSIISIVGLTPGNTYYIQADSYGFDAGTFCMEVQDDGVICYNVTNITFNNITATTAEVSWTSNGSETEWEIIYGETGFDPENEGTSIIDNDELGETLTDLDPETTYDVYVRALCEEDNNSDFNVSQFTTTALPICNMPTEITFNNITETTAEVSWTSNGDETKWEIIYGETGFDPENEGISIIDTDELGEILTDLNPETTYDVYVRALCGEDNNSDFNMSQFTTEAPEPCAVPSNISVSSITATSAMISWTSNGEETEWQVIYGEEGFNPETEGTTISVNETPEVTIENLDPETAYEVYVVAVCGEDNLSEMAGPEGFNTTFSTATYDFNGFAYYPNPVKAQLTLKADSTIKQIVIYNILGQKVIQGTPNSIESQVDVSALQEGMYLMKVTIGETEKAFRFIKD